MRRVTGDDRRFPWLATAVVLAAVALFVALGVWQLQRKAWKEALIAHYAVAARSPATVAWPRPGEAAAALYRRSVVHCLAVNEMTAVSGTSAAGVDGWAHLATCRLAEGGEGRIELGWAADPTPRTWRGGEVRGILAPWRKHDALLIASPPLAGLAPLAAPDPAAMPNNHLAYAIQWFGFAVVALAVYGAALRRTGEAGGNAPDSRGAS